MLKIKQSQVLIAMIDGAGILALGEYIFQITSMIWLGVLVSVLMFGLTAWILIKNQDNGHSNVNGYENMLVFFLSLAGIALHVHWVVAVVLFVICISVGIRYYSTTIGPDTKR